MRRGHQVEKWKSVHLRLFERETTLRLKIGIKNWGCRQENGDFSKLVVLLHTLLY